MIFSSFNEKTLKFTYLSQRINIIGLYNQLSLKYYQKSNNSKLHIIFDIIISNIKSNYLVYITLKQIFKNISIKF